MKTVFIIAEHAHINGKPANYELSHGVYIYIYIFFFFNFLIFFFFSITFVHKIYFGRNNKNVVIHEIGYGKSKEDKLLAKKISAYFVSFQQHCWPVR